MNAAGSSWHREFEIGTPGRGLFFAGPEDLLGAGAKTSQDHVLRRAFDLLNLDGIYSTPSAPLVYFKCVSKIDPDETTVLHRRFWNHGGAPLLVVVAPDRVHVYSGLVRPAPASKANDEIAALVQRLDRASAALREFLPSVESGEFFRRHAPSFDANQRVDRDLLDNLQAARQRLIDSSTEPLDLRTLDVLLCRLVFACYLFDRGIVGQSYLEFLGLPELDHLRQVLCLQPRVHAQKCLYDLFRKLADDFNGDLFAGDLAAEARNVPAAWMEVLEDFFYATDIRSGQSSFWPYDFGCIPVEAISAIYERFLKDADKKAGAFYTPRFLAELVLDLALAEMPSLLDRRYLDPACGSGIFLVGLFNRMAEEWKRTNPQARNDRRANELRKILCNALHGVDVDLTACRITAFSLYLAYLDQLSPRDIQELRRKGHKLPRLVRSPDTGNDRVEGNIRCGDFFAPESVYPDGVDLVIGNPPWGSTAVAGTPAALWCADLDHPCPIPDKQMAAAFLWKAPHHVTDGGSLTLVLPHGILFNLSPRALQFQRTLFERHAVDRVLNLADYQRFLFEEAGHPALVITYRKNPPSTRHHPVEYLAPKADWLAMRAEILAVSPEDRSVLTVDQVLRDLEGPDAPQIWKRWYWATARDRRLIDRLSLYPRLRDRVRRPHEKVERKPWILGVGFQPVGPNDDPEKAETLALPSDLFIPATSRRIALFLLPEDCTKLPAAETTVRSGSNKNIEVFQAPHVLVAKGFTRVAFADFPVSFQDALRGIAAPPGDRDLLIFLAAYLRSSLARYFLFQTSSNWGVSRQVVHVEELLRLPFPLPDDLPDPEQAWERVREVSRLVTHAAARANTDFVDRDQTVRAVDEAVEGLVDGYFDVLPDEKALVRDTLEIVVPSVRPTRGRPAVPTLDPSRPEQRQRYTERLCDTLNGWARNGPFLVRGHAIASGKLGIGVVLLRKAPAAEPASAVLRDADALLDVLARLRKAASRKLSRFELIRGTMVFDRDCLYLIKPVGQRFWTQTAALNDADEIAGALLTHRLPRQA